MEQDTESLLTVLWNLDSQQQRSIYLTTHGPMSWFYSMHWPFMAHPIFTIADQ